MYGKNEMLQILKVWQIIKKEEEKQYIIIRIWFYTISIKPLKTK